MSKDICFRTEQEILKVLAELKIQKTDFVQSKVPFSYYKSFGGKQIQSLSDEKKNEVKVYTMHIHWTINICVDDGYDTETERMINHGIKDAGECLMRQFATINCAPNLPLYYLSVFVDSKYDVILDQTTFKIKVEYY